MMRLLIRVIIISLLIILFIAIRLIIW